MHRRRRSRCNLPLRGCIARTLSLPSVLDSLADFGDKMNKHSCMVLGTDYNIHNTDTHNEEPLVIVLEGWGVPHHLIPDSHHLWCSAGRFLPVPLWPFSIQGFLVMTCLIS